MKADAPRIGQTTDNIQHRGLRDAFHVPVVLVSSERPITPGERVRFTDEEFNEVVPCDSREDSHAVADPYLDPDVQAIPSGTLFWVMLNPGMVTDLIHSYSIRQIVFENDVVNNNNNDDGCGPDCP